MANSQSRGQAPIAPELSVGGWLRFLWRQLTSMRVALLLLMLLAVAAIPGSVFPQWDQDAVATAQYVADHPDSAVWLDRLGFFSVYSSPWFSAIYLLLFTSLIGCIIPRVGVYATALRMPPPRVPRVLTRFLVTVCAPGKMSMLLVRRLGLLRRCAGASVASVSGGFFPGGRWPVVGCR